MGLIFRASIVLPIWLERTRTRPPGVSPPQYNILPVQILTSRFQHFTEAAQGFDKITYSHQGNDFEETLFYHILLSCEDPLGFHFENENNLESDKSQ
ncbi:hypothetical protein TNCV_3632081 [Trichonephila clavipes]|nr:hypothetical protein TNCV_3632081 [Trichonephila clavipes]